MAFTTINKSSDYFNTKIYTGNGGTQSITDLGFQPDLTWIKQRGGTTNNVLYDAVRGAYWTIQSNTTASQTADDGLTTWNSGGWNMANVSTTNGNGLSYVGWNWKANGQGSSNTDGSINTTYTSANTTSGFSIVKWTSTDTAGSTMGHGLGAVPKMIITKKISSGNPNYWTTYHNSIGNTKSIFLNDTGAESGASTSYWNDTSPTSSVFSTGTYFDAGDYIAYCFAEKTGYSKFGSYFGNNNADGKFVYTGFKPAFVMVKRAGGGTQSWGIVDNKRSNYNLISAMLNPDSSGTEGGNNGMDLLSNGFKMRSSDGNSNGYADKHIYMAFAEAPLVGSNNVPCTAR